MRILVSNDDGVYSPGIKALAGVLEQIAEVSVIAPDRNRSAASHSLTLDTPLRIQTLDNGFISVRGTPTDCVHLAINELMQEALPDMVVSGINEGANLGDDVLYSGTVAAATEGRNLGLPAMAVSLVGKEHFATAAAVAVRLVQTLCDFPLANDQILNVNVPDLPLEQLKGIKVARLGHRHRAENMVKMIDPRGHQVYWLGPPGAKQDAGAGTDFHAVEQGYVSITPLQVDLTAYGYMGTLTHWIEQITFIEP